MDEFWTSMLQSTLLILVNALVPVLAAYLVAQIRVMWATTRQSQPDVMGQVEAIAVQVVRAAEQNGAAGYVSDKKAYALSLAEKWLEAKGIRVDMELLDAAIEAAVFAEFNRYTWPPEEETPTE